MAPDTPSSATPTLTLQARFPSDWSLADLQRRLGGIPLDRIRLVPPPGCATEEDLIRLGDQEDRLCELEDGILVEKPVGWYESMIAMLIGIEIGSYLKTHDLGKVLSSDGSLKILPGTVKIPDVSFISWGRWPKERLARRPIPALVPDLVVEVLSASNTQVEMDEKLAKYFRAGVRLVWYIDPERRAAKSYLSLNDVTEVTTEATLDGGEVLPGFQLSLRILFEEADRQGPLSS